MLNALLWNLLLTAGLALVLATICRLPSLQRRPALIHWLWLLLLVKLVTPPLIPVPLLPAVDGGVEAVDVATPVGGPREHGEWDWAEPSLNSRSIDAPVSASNDQTIATEKPAVTPYNLSATAPFPYEAGLLVLSLAGTCLLLLLHGVRAVQFGRWLNRAAMDEPSLAATCADLASSMGIRSTPRSRVVDTRTTPLLWAWSRPMVVVPRQLVDELHPEQLRSILAHELAHLVRRDHWANLFVCIVKVLLWWNPVVWWADRELRVAQEMCCDAMAIERCRAQRSTYAATLLRTLDFIQPPVAKSRLALGMGSRGTILRRFEMIGEKELSYRMSRWAILGLLILGTALACMPVRGQEETSPATSETHGAATPTQTESGEAAASVDRKPREAVGNRQPPHSDVQPRIVQAVRSASPSIPTNADHGEPDPVDPEIRDLAAAARQRLFAWSGTATLTLKDGESGRIKVKKNITPVREVLLTPQFEEGGTKFDLVGLDADGEPIEGVEFSSGVLRDHVFQTGSKPLPIVVDGRKVLFTTQLTCSRQDDGCVRVEARLHFPLDTTPEESEAMRSAQRNPAGSIDPETRKLGDAARKRLTTPSGRATLTLKDGETERIKIEKNITPVAEILMTPHFEEGGFRFDMVGVDAKGEPVDGVRYTSATIRDKRFDTMSKELPFAVDGRNVNFRSIVNFKRQEDRPVVAEVRVFFNLPLSARESEAMRLTARRPANPMHPGMRKLGEVAHKRLSTYPNVQTFTLKDGETGRMKIKKNITPVAEILVTPHIEADGTKFDVEGVDSEGEPVAEVRCTTAEVPDDVTYTKSIGLRNVVEGQAVMFKVQLTRWSQDDGRVIAEVKVLFTPHPTPEEMNAMRLTKPKPIQGSRSKQSIYGTRPTGNCSLGGRVVSAETGEPIEQARVSLHYLATQSSIYVQVDDDGKFLFKDIPTGPHSLRTTNTAGYQDTTYNPGDSSADYPEFSLADGEQRLNLVLKAKPAYRISGRIRDSDGAVPDEPQGFSALAWYEKDGRYQCKRGLVKPTDGSYVIDGLDGLPVYVMVENWRDTGEKKHVPPVYYPSTFSRDEAKQIVFGENRSIEGIDIALRTEGGLTLEGKVVDEDGTPVPEVFVVVYQADMYAGYLTAYTDERGQYRIRCLGDGEFLVHFDAVHRGYVRTRTAVGLDDETKLNTCNVTLSKGVLISGKFVDEEGSDWKIGRSSGKAVILDKANETVGVDSGGMFNKYGPANVVEHPFRTFLKGEGAYRCGEMIFPTKSTFAVHGMIPGQTKLQFLPRTKDQEVLEIRYKGQNVRESGFETTAGETIEDVTIVIGKKDGAR